MGRLVEQLSEQATRLVRAEIALAKAELADKAKRSAIGIGLLVVAAVIVLYAIGVLIWAAIIGLAEAWPLWLSALVIGVVLMLVAGGLGLGGAALLQRVARKPEAIDRVKDDVTAIKDLCERYGANGIMVFTTVTVEALSTVHTRMFAPPIGVTEDPATGSASGALGAYLVHNGVIEIRPTTEVIAEQGYEIDRPSRILIQVESDDDAIQEVKVGGAAVLVAEGTLRF
jgi:hypothetical protein